MKYAVAAAALAVAILSGPARSSAEPLAQPQQPPSQTVTTVTQPSAVTKARHAPQTTPKRVSQVTELPGGEPSTKQPRPAWEPPGYPLDRAYIQRLVQQMNVPGDGGG